MMDEESHSLDNSSLSDEDSHQGSSNDTFLNPNEFGNPSTGDNFSGFTHLPNDFAEENNFDDYLRNCIKDFLRAKYFPSFNNTPFGNANITVNNNYTVLNLSYNAQITNYTESVQNLNPPDQNFYSEYINSEEQQNNFDNYLRNCINHFFRAKYFLSNSTPFENANITVNNNYTVFNLDYNVQTTNYNEIVQNLNPPDQNFYNESVNSNLNNSYTDYFGNNYYSSNDYATWNSYSNNVQNLAQPVTRNDFGETYLQEPNNVVEENLDFNNFHHVDNNYLSNLRYHNDTFIENLNSADEQIFYPTNNLSQETYDFPNEHFYFNRFDHGYYSPLNQDFNPSRDNHIFKNLNFTEQQIILEESSNESFSNYSVQAELDSSSDYENDVVYNLDYNQPYTGSGINQHLNFETDVENDYIDLTQYLDVDGDTNNSLD